MEKFDSLKNNSNWGGSREGAGRPEGSQNESTKTKQQAERELKERIIADSQKLLDSQMTIAKGCTYLLVQKFKKDNKGNKTKDGRPEVVTNPEIIADYIDGALDEEDLEYYFITTERPDNKALDSLLDRAFGKAVSNIDVTSKGKQLEGIKVEIVNPRGEDDVPTLETN